jgi:signal peptidase I
MSDAAHGGTCRTLIRRCLRLVERFLAIFALLVIVYWLCFDYSHVASESMEPTLMGRDFDCGDQVLTERISYRFRQPRRWEVATIRSKDDQQIMKRVVGLPGETIQMLRGGRILIDGQPVELPQNLRSLNYFPFGNLSANQKVSCGDGFYVLGDFSRDSDDSRFNGPVKPEQIIGRAWLIVGPVGRRGFVNP